MSVSGFGFLGVSVLGFGFFGFFFRIFRLLGGGVLGVLGFWG